MALRIPPHPEERSEGPRLEGREMPIQRMPYCSAAQAFWMRVQASVSISVEVA